MEIFTVGFTRTTAENFFDRLRANRIERLLDVRLNNRSQLAGFAKRDDLAYFLRELLSARYEQEPLLAPTQDLLDDFKKRREMPWEEYERRFLALLQEREVERVLDPEAFSRRTVLLCSESTPEHCHRRLVGEYLQRHWGDVEIIHL